MGRGRMSSKAGGWPRPQPDRIVIPDLTGFIGAALLRSADEVGFTLAIADPPISREALLSSGRWVVAEQDPPAGSTRFRGDTVVVVLRHQGGGSPAGDREPLRPLPRRRVGRADLPVDPPSEPPLRLVGRSDRSDQPDRAGYAGAPPVQQD